MNLWTYIGRHPDTEFGGKTGTSNNHSDAWFVGVSPHLVCGAWVGGEYRAIHFRTGQLGQGSRTALPVCGLFFQSTLDDDRFPQYHGKFIGKEGIEDLTDQMYIGPSYRMRADTDTMATDSVFTLEHTDGSTLTSPLPTGEPSTETPEPRQGTPNLPVGKNLQP